MTAKDFFRDIRRTRLEIKSLDEMCQELRASLIPSGTRYDRVIVQTSPKGDQYEEVFSEIDEVERKIRDHLKELTEKYSKAVEMITQLEDSDQRTVIATYYLSADRPTWDEVADKMHYSKRRILDFHEQAMVRLEDIWNS